jgi:hypothetical protein
MREEKSYRVQLEALERDLQSGTKSGIDLKPGLVYRDHQRLDNNDETITIKENWNADNSGEPRFLQNFHVYDRESQEDNSHSKDLAKRTNFLD